MKDTDNDSRRIHLTNTEVKPDHPDYAGAVHKPTLNLLYVVVTIGTVFVIGAHLMDGIQTQLEADLIKAMAVAWTASTLLHLGPRLVRRVRDR